MAYDYKVPYTERGLAHFAGYGVPDDKYDWRDNDEFEATMRVQERVVSGRSAKYVYVTDTKTDQDYPMFVAELVRLAARATINGGVVSGRWRVRKRGKNYGIEWKGGPK